MHQLWIIAGPNGSGKTTLTRRHIAGKLPVLNPDEIAAELDPLHPDAPEIALRAGREILARRKGYLARTQSFAMETTFSGNREIALIKDAKAAGYKVNLVFICTDSPKISMGRITLRVQAGGHRVPGTDVERRYRRSLANLPEGLALVDRAWLLDNSRTRMRLIASLERGQVKSVANSLPRWVRSAKLPVLEQGMSL